MTARRAGSGGGPWAAALSVGGLGTVGLIVVWAALSVASAKPAPEPAELVLRGAAVYTLDASRSWASAVAVRGGRIAYVGNSAGARRHIGPATRVLELPGRLILPAFQDAHIHPVTSGVEIGLCALSEASTPEAVQEEVRRCAARQEGEWLLGSGWQLPVFPAANPSKDLLDGIAGDRPAYLTAADGHSAWVNSRALELAGIGAATPDPPGGRIERGAGGEPSGTLRENAMSLVARLVPPPSLEARLDGLRRAQELLLRHGVTAVQEAAAGPAELETYRAAAARGELRLEVVAALETDPERGPAQVRELASLRERFAGPRLHPTVAKIFLDGVIEARTAAMLEPYLDRPGERGELNWPVERLEAVVAALAAAGFDVHVHAIGDGAVRAALDAFEAARGEGAAANEAPRLRHQIAHLEVIHPDDVPRFRELGVIANFQPLWAFADSYIVDLTWPALGPGRSRWIYPMGSVARAGGILAFGSDWSVSSLDPLEGIQVALTRQDPQGPLDNPQGPLDNPQGPLDNPQGPLDNPEGSSPAAAERLAHRHRPMQPAEVLDLPEALAAYTIGAAWANRLEQESGSIEVGKVADLVVLSEDLFGLPRREIARARVLLTFDDGEVVYAAPEGVGPPGLRIVK